jgi:hypothetical protein
MTSKYNFNNNLLNLSQNKNIDDAIKEWLIIYNEERSIQSGHCICQRKVKNIFYLVNKLNNNCISTGVVCCKKFNINCYLNEGIVKNIYSENISNGNYEIIDNLIIYKNNIQDQIIDYFNKKLDIHMTNIADILDIINEIEDSIKLYNIDYLNDIKIKCIKQQELLKTNNLKKLQENNITMNETKDNIKIYNIDYLNCLKNIRIKQHELLKTNNLTNPQENEIEDNIMEDNFTEWVCGFCNVSNVENSVRFYNQNLCYNCSIIKHLNMYM